MIKFIDTEPDKNKHTPLCSCEFCMKMKEVMFGGLPEDFFEDLKTKNPLLWDVLKTDGFCK